MSLRILHLIPTLENGGAERQLAILAGAQRRAGHDVAVGVLRGGPNEERLEEQGVPVHRISSNGHYDPRLIASATMLVRRLRPNVVQTWLPLMDVVGAVATRLTRTPWVIAERSNAEAYVRFNDRALRLPVGRFADAVVANSEGGKAVWEGRLRGPVAVVGNVVPRNEIDAALPAELSSLGIAPGTPVILFVGRLSWEKNINVLMDALSRVVQKSGATALVCGTGPLQSVVDHAVAASGGRIKYLGERTDVWRLMKAATLLVAPSVFEGNPTVVIEAAAAGCPLLISDIDAHRRILTDDSAAFVEVADAPALASAIERALSDREGSASRAKKAAELLGRLTPDAAAKQYDAVYHSILRDNH
ncbi:MAG: glycosyltransferase family 4 protein [Gemmatimonadota bacterium]|nr:glycosyltransferase family 4 protein [Gemmatimonadota bacterium]